MWFIMEVYEFFRQLSDIDYNYTITVSEKNQYHSVKTKHGEYFFVSMTLEKAYDCLTHLKAAQLIDFGKKNGTV